jgi:cell division protein FtsZ
VSEDILIKNPLLVVGIGGAGSRLAKKASEAIGCDCLLVSNDKRDLDGSDNSIFVNSGKWVNPSTYKLRSFASAKQEQIRAKLEGFGTIIVVANLAGRAGAAMAPVVCGVARKTGTVISFAIMPFGFEKDRLFSAGVSLRRMREASHSTVVMDNDAFLDNNPELSEEECYSATNSAIVEVASSLASRSVRPDMNILSTSRASDDSQACLRDSVLMLYQNIADTGAIRRTVVYVMGGDKLPISQLNQLVGHAQGIFKEEGTTEVAMSSIAATTTEGSGGVRVHVVASAPQKTRFDAYDPLGELFSADSHLDWDEPDSAPDLELAIPVVE